MRMQICFPAGKSKIFNFRKYLLDRLSCRRFTTCMRYSFKQRMRLPCQTSTKKYLSIKRMTGILEVKVSNDNKRVVVCHVNVELILKPVVREERTVKVVIKISGILFSDSQVISRCYSNNVLIYRFKLDQVKSSAMFCRSNFSTCSFMNFLEMVSLFLT